MAGYTKLFSTILASTIWREDNDTRIVWITLLAMADRNGLAEGSVPGLADFARVTVEGCRRALEKLSAPDPDSRSKEYEGRRVLTVEGGWRLVNHAKYRAKMSADERREYLKLKQREHRRKLKPKRVNKKSTNVNKRQQLSTLSTHAEAEAEAVLDRDKNEDPDIQRDRDHAHTPRARDGKLQTLSRDHGLQGSGSDRRRHGSQHAWCDWTTGMCVPNGLHAEFVRRLNAADAEERLRKWYPDVLKGYEGQAIGDDVFVFWRQAFTAWVGTVSNPTPTTTKTGRSIRAAQSAIARFEREK